MYKIPLEMVLRHVYKTVGDFFAEKVSEERKRNKVAILVEDFTHSLYFMDCDENGYPKRHDFRYMTFNSFDMVAIQNEGVLSTVNASMNIEEISIYIDRPLISQNYNYDGYPVVFMWSGKKMSSRKIPLDQLNVSELMKLAQRAIKNREGLIIDEAIKNKIYK